MNQNTAGRVEEAQSTNERQKRGKNTKEKNTPNKKEQSKWEENTNFWRKGKKEDSRKTEEGRINQRKIQQEKAVRKTSKWIEDNRTRV